MSCSGQAMTWQSKCTIAILCRFCHTWTLFQVFASIRASPALVVVENHPFPCGRNHYNGALRPAIHGQHSSRPNPYHAHHLNKIGVVVGMQRRRRKRFSKGQEAVEMCAVNNSSAPDNPLFTSTRPWHKFSSWFYRLICLPQSIHAHCKVRCSYDMCNIHAQTNGWIE